MLPLWPSSPMPLPRMCTTPMPERSTALLFMLQLTSLSTSQSMDTLLPTTQPQSTTPLQWFTSQLCTLPQSTTPPQWSTSLLSTQLQCITLPLWFTSQSMATRSQLMMPQLCTLMSTVLLMTTPRPTLVRTRRGTDMPLLASTVLPFPTAAPRLSPTTLLMPTLAMLLM